MYTDRPALDEKRGHTPDKKICDLDGVSGGDIPFPVSLWKDGDSGRIVLRAINEGGFACTDIDFHQLTNWLGKRSGKALDGESVYNEIASRFDTK